MTTPDQALTREHVIELSNNERLAVAGCGCKAARENLNGQERIFVTSCNDAALREQLNRSMRVQEQLAENVNTGLLEIRSLKQQLARDHRDWAADYGPSGNLLTDNFGNPLP